MFRYMSLTCVLMFAGVLSAQTIPVQTVETTPIVGIAAGQTARMNLLNPGVVLPTGGPECTAIVSFVQGSGSVLKTVTVTIDPGKNQAIDLHSDSDLNLVATGDRKEIRATVTTPALTPVSGTPTTTPAPACKLIATLEIFNVISGQTQVTIGRLVAVPAVQTSTASSTN